MWSAVAVVVEAAGTFVLATYNVVWSVVAVSSFVVVDVVVDVFFVVLALTR